MQRKTVKGFNMLAQTKRKQDLKKAPQWWPERWRPQGRPITGGGGPERVPNLRREGKGELTSCRGTVWSAWQKPPVRRKGGRAGLPVRVSGRHVVRGRQSPPILEVRPDNRQVWWKRSSYRWDGRQLTLDKTVGSRVWWHTQGSSGRPALDLGWRSSSKTAPGSLSTGSPAGRTPPHGDGSMYSQANVRVESVLRLPIRALPSVILGDTDKVLREADWPVESDSTKRLLRVERWSPLGALRNRVEAGEEPEDHKRSAEIDWCSGKR